MGANSASAILGFVAAQPPKARAAAADTKIWRGLAINMVDALKKEVLKTNDARALSA